jgi:hypothetical protein
MNAELGRKVLDYVTAHREQLDMGDFGRYERCGTVACLAGWTLLLSGYTLTSDLTFMRPDGSRVHAGPGPGDEAARLLNLTAAEEDGEPGAPWPLFYAGDEDAAIARFRELVEAAEAGAS